MPQYTIPVPAGFAEIDAGRIDAFLRNRGYAVDGSAVSVNDTGAPTSVTVWADRDPTGEFANYVATDTPDQSKQKQAIQTIKAAVQAIRAKPPAQRTATENVIEAIAVLLRDDA